MKKMARRETGADGHHKRLRLFQQIVTGPDTASIIKEDVLNEDEKQIVNGQTAPINEVADGGQALQQLLLPGLQYGSDDFTQTCILSRLSHLELPRLRLVSQRWNRILSGPTVPRLRVTEGLQERWLFAEVYNGATDTTSWKAFDFRKGGSWHPVPPVPCPGHDRILGTASGVVEGHIVVAGGQIIGRERPTSAVFAYSPLSGRWHRRASMRQARQGALFGVLDGELYVLGGVDNTQTYIDTGECYNLQRDEWRDVANDNYTIANRGVPSGRKDEERPTRRYYIPPWRQVSVHGRALSCSSNRCGTVDSYYPQEGKWRKGGPVGLQGEEAAACRGAYLYIDYLQRRLFQAAKKAPWQVGRVMSKPSLAGADAASVSLDERLPPLSTPWSVVSDFTRSCLDGECQKYPSHPGAIMGDGCRFYLVQAHLQVIAFQVSQHGTRCTLVHCDTKHQDNYVVSCHLFDI
ncbi:hypothetical protein L7F22_036861 [Adiantum nelumboides]|nr:hypothetical protein [Adiantum nelumboides]